MCHTLETLAHTQAELMTYAACTSADRLCFIQSVFIPSLLDTTYSKQIHSIILP